jgi:CheY-like chemotaxis protein
MSNILIIDDDDVTCCALRRMAADEGHDVSWRNTLRDGVQLALSRSFDVVFLPVRMSDGNGLDMLPVIQAAPSAPEIIIMTGAGEPDAAETAIKKRGLGLRGKGGHPGGDQAAAGAGDTVPAGEDLLLPEERHRSETRGYRRQQPEADRLPRPRRPGGGERYHRPDHGRNRHGKGTHCPGHPQKQRAGSGQFRGGGLRRPARYPGGKPPVRPRKGGLYRRGKGARRPDPPGSRRNAVSG